MHKLIDQSGKLCDTDITKATLPAIPDAVSEANGLLGTPEPKVEEDDGTNAFRMDLELYQNIGKEITVGGQKLMFEKAFIEKIAKAYIGIGDIEKIANTVHEWMHRQGWLKLDSKLIFIVNQTPNESGFLFGYNSGELTSRRDQPVPTIGFIFLFSDKFDQGIVKAQEACAGLEKKKRRQIVMQMLKGENSFKIAHELVHAFGINRMSSRFENLPLNELELLTDSIAFTCCSNLTGKGEASIAASYLLKELTARNEQSDVESLSRLAASVIQTQRGL